MIFELVILNGSLLILCGQSAAVMNSGLLLMAVMGLLSPAVLYYTHTELHFGKSELALSRFTSCIMLVVYASYIFYQLKIQKGNHDHQNEVCVVVFILPCLSTCPWTPWKVYLDI